MAGREPLDHIERVDTGFICVGCQGHVVSTLPKVSARKRTAPHMRG
jgi:hypothetical protein